MACIVRIPTNIYRGDYYRKKPTKKVILVGNMPSQADIYNGQISTDGLL